MSVTTCGPNVNGQLTCFHENIMTLVWFVVKDDIPADLRQVVGYLQNVTFVRNN